MWRCMLVMMSKSVFSFVIGGTCISFKKSLLKIRF
jgi:hypothetical protein